jgi:hypothetical protein
VRNQPLAGHDPPSQDCLSQALDCLLDRLAAALIKGRFDRNLAHHKFSPEKTRISNTALDTP